MVTKLIKVQHDSGISVFGHYKCPFFIFGEWSWEKLSRFLYILSIFILKEKLFNFSQASQASLKKSWAKSVVVSPC